MARKTTHLWAEIQGWLDELHWAPSQAQLAERLGLKSRSVITDWKYGASRPTPVHLAKLAREMELTAGPHIYQRLVFAVMADLGYDISFTVAKAPPTLADARRQRAAEHEADARALADIERLRQQLRDSETSSETRHVAEEAGGRPNLSAVAKEGLVEPPGEFD